MSELKVGDTVQMTGSVMTGNVGTVISVDAEQGRYLVQVTPQAQDWIPDGDLELFRP